MLNGLTTKAEDMYNQMTHGRPTVSEEVVVSGAMMRCTMAPPGNFVRFMIPDGHDKYVDFMQNYDARQICADGPGGKMAHEHHCARDVNIPRFSRCRSDIYIRELGNIKTNLSKEKRRLDSTMAGLDKTSEVYKGYKEKSDGLKATIDKYEALCNSAEANKLIGVKQNDCVLELLDKWFDASQASVISSLFTDLYTIRKNIEDITGWELPSKLHSLGQDFKKYTQNNKGVYSGISDAVAYLNDSGPDAGAKVRWYDEETFYSNRTRLLELLEQLQGMMTVGLLEEINYFCEESVQSVCNSILVYTKYFIQVIQAYDCKADCEGLLRRVENVANRAKYIHQSYVENGGPTEHHTLTKDSYLVCKLGGMIEFESTGQIDIIRLNYLNDAIKDLLLYARAETENRLADCEEEPFFVDEVLPVYADFARGAPGLHTDVKNYRSLWDSHTLLECFIAMLEDDPKGAEAVKDFDLEYITVEVLTAKDLEERRVKGGAMLSLALGIISYANPVLGPWIMGGTLAYNILNEKSIRDDMIGMGAEAYDQAKELRSLRPLQTSPKLKAADAFNYITMATDAYTALTYTSDNIEEFFISVNVHTWNKIFTYSLWTNLQGSVWGKEMAGREVLIKEYADGDPKEWMAQFNYRIYTDLATGSILEGTQEI